ncbi:acyl-CoA dehydrogenase family protein [Amycolatopsis taiwanensis]|uniref:acyl-CoA dehydrogenase family protein n=1 Tax=Amycolatopsis taiwanensis TaxID=342230 RepID=UPI0004BBEAB5|nr:acyl-CoA dehydrogenase family protein [Amycolatopsis taiwanensis]
MGAEAAGQVLAPPKATNGVPELAPASDSAARMLRFLRQYAREFLNTRLMDERRALPPALVSDFAEAGLFGMVVPKQYQGQELSSVDMTRVFIQLGAIDANLAILCAVHNTLGTLPIALFANDEVKRNVVPRAARGQILTTSAISEAGIGTHVRGLTTHATKHADGSYTINGSKKWISLGGDARYVNVFAKVQDERGKALGITALLVDNRTPGFNIGPEMLTLGLRAVPQYDLTFTDLRVPPSALLGVEGEGFSVCKAAFMAGRVVLAATSMGAAMRSLEVAQRFATRREVATGRLSENGRIRQIFADAGAAIQAIETLVFRIGTWRDAGQVVPDAWYFCAKILGCELAWRTVDTALQMLAARGFLDTNIVGQHFRDYRLFRIFEGSTEAITVYLGAIMARNPEAFAAMVYERTSAPQVLDLVDQVTQIMAKRAGDTAGRHVHAAVVGELVCWTLMAAVTSGIANNSAMHAYTASWVERQLRDRLRSAHQDLYIGDLPTTEEFADHIAGYRGMIGDIDQKRWPGEEWRVDPLLRR